MNLNSLLKSGATLAPVVKTDVARLSDPPAIAKGINSRQTRTTSYSSSAESHECYNRIGNLYPLNLEGTNRISPLDRGTAAGTTVFINRNAFDKIASETTFGNVKWEEMGVDDEKRWIVINGQRFECEHSPEEKALRRKYARMNLVDILTDQENDKKKSAKGNDNGKDKPRGNIASLQDNPVVMQLLGQTFNTGSTDEILKQLA